MGKRKTTKQFVAEATTKHGLKYNYDSIEYLTIDNPVKIICPIHGEFQQTPRIHLMGSGCKQCYREEQKIQMTLTTAEFIKRANTKHQFRYDYTDVDYVNAHTKINIICNHHGLFNQTPTMHLTGQGCPECGKMISGRRKSNEKFIEDLKNIYHNTFDYSLIQYVNGTTPVTIICKEHGKFSMRPDYLLDNKISCPECVFNSKKNTDNRKGGYCKSFFNTNPDKKNQDSIFYIVKLENEIEEFIKIGITTQKLKYRFPKMRIGGYKVSVITTTTMSLFEAYTYEQQIIKKYDNHQYYPINKFNGWSECFNLKIPLKSIS